MDEREFKAKFITEFCAAWCVRHHDEYCACGQHEKLENPPIDEAVYLADQIWTKNSSILRRLS